jgi:4-hydroxy-tetrahydrodipicolinate synthase
VSISTTHSVVGSLPGVIPPLITPLTLEGALDRDALARHVETLIADGVTGLFVLGSSGEGPWLTPDQRETVVATAAEAAAGRVPVLAGVLDPGATVAIDNAARAATAGASAIVVTTPYYFAANHDTQMRHFALIADASTVPVILYNIPEMTHNRLDPETVAELAAHPNIVGIKDSNGNQDDFARFLAIRAAHPGFVVFQGHERSAGKALLAGADGVVPGLGNLAPSVFVEMAQRANTGDRVAVGGLQEQIERLWHLHVEDIWLVCLKYACSLNGIGSGATAGHAGQLTDASKNTIARLVASDGVLETMR